MEPYEPRSGQQRHERPGVDLGRCCIWRCTPMRWCAKESRWMSRIAVSPTSSPCSATLSVEVDCRRGTATIRTPRARRSFRELLRSLATSSTKLRPPASCVAAASTSSTSSLPSRHAMRCRKCTPTAARAACVRLMLRGRGWKTDWLWRERRVYACVLPTCTRDQRKRMARLRGFRGLNWAPCAPILRTASLSNTGSAHVKRK